MTDDVESDEVKIRKQFEDSSSGNYDRTIFDLVYFIRWAAPLMSLVMLLLIPVVVTLLVLAINLKSTVDSNHDSGQQDIYNNRAISCQVILDLHQQLPADCKVQGVVQKLQNPSAPNPTQG